MARRRASKRASIGAALAALAASSACSAILGVKGDRQLSNDGDDDAGTETGAAIDSSLDIATEAPPSPDAALPFDPAQATARADEAIEALLLNFWTGETVANASTATPVSAFAQSWEALVDAVARHRGARFQGMIRTFYDAAKGAGWSFQRYDDENWIVLALLDAFDVTGDQTYLLDARMLYRDIMTAWDTTCCGDGGVGAGGIWNDRAQKTKSTAVNAGAVISGARLYERTKLTQYRSFATQTYEYWSKVMVDPATHQVMDDISATGVVPIKYTSNQGLMIGAAIALARATNDSSLRKDAHGYAAFLLAKETGQSPSGPILNDGDAMSCAGECPQYKGVAARYLAELFAEDRSHVDYVDLLARCAQSLGSVRDSHGLYGPDWASAYSGAAQLGAMSSAATALAAIASLGGPVTTDPPHEYQAEEATLHGVGLEAMNTGYSGWGYVDGWGCASSPSQDPVACSQKVDGQEVGFDVDAPSEGAFDLTFDYAAIAFTPSDAASMTAVRRLTVNDGAFVVDNLSFAPHQEWTDWRSEAVPRVPLQAGPNRVSLTFDAQRGSYGFINLDRLVVTSCPTNAGENLLAKQPTAGDWHPTFGGPFTVAVAGYVCNEQVIHWADSGVPIQNWIKIYPAQAPFNVNFLPGQSYVASISLSGVGTYHLDVWDSGPGPDGGPGAGDNYSPPVALTSVPHSFEVPFQMGSGNAADVQIQVRVDGPGQAVDVDLRLWHVAIYKK